MNLFSKKTLPIITMVLTILLAACGPTSNASATPNPTDAISAINTIVMQTVNAQYTATAAVSTPTVTPADIPSLTSPPLLAFVSPTPFTDTTLNTISSSACDNSAYISDVTIPDNTVVETGQTFVKTWMLQNTGSCTWDANYTLAFVSGDEMGGTSTPLAASVAPGQDVDVSVTLTAPTTTGQETSYWQLVNDTGATFGVTVYALIDVVEDSTETPTVTPETPTIWPTTTPTIISTTASTIAPTMTSTNVPTATPTVIPTAIPSTTPTITPTATPTDNPTTAS